MLHSGQQTIPASGGPIQLITTRTPAYELIVQNNAGHVCRVGDASTSTNKGTQLAASGAINSIVYYGPYTALSIEISSVWVAGTSGDVIDFSYVK